MSDSEQCPKCGIEGEKIADCAAYKITASPGHPFGKSESIPVHIVDSPACLKHQLAQRDEKLAKLRDENERLQAIMGELAKSKDGVFMVPGVAVVWHPSIRDSAGALVPLEVNPGGSATRASTLYVSRCYSTRAAAEAAKETS